MHKICLFSLVGQWAIFTRFAGIVGMYRSHQRRLPLRCRSVATMTPTVTVICWKALQSITKYTVEAVSEKPTSHPPPQSGWIGPIDPPRKKAKKMIIVVGHRLLLATPRPIFFKSHGLFFWTPIGHFFSRVTGYFFGPLGKFVLESRASFLDP